MTTIDVMDGTGERPSVPRRSSSSREILSLLGFEAGSGAPTDEECTPLGDAIAMLADRLAIRPQRSVLACADVTEHEDERQRVGDVFPVGELSALAAATRRVPGRLTFVADATDPHESMAEFLRAAVDLAVRSSVLGVLSLGEAAERSLGLRERARTGSLVPPDRRRRSAQLLFERSLVASRVVLDWELVSAIAVGHLSHLDAGEFRARFELAMVRDIARRHMGITAPIMWPEERELNAYTPDIQFTILAHVVQSVADGDLSAVPQYAERAREALGVPQSPEGLKLLGAVGRALSAIGDYDGSIETLAGALNGWLETNPREGSYALCELLRIEGILGRLNRVNALRETAQEIMAVLDFGSRSHVNLAAGRALAQAGGAKEALEVLMGESTNDHAPRHVQTAAHRWRAAAARNLGDPGVVAQALSMLDRLGESDQRVLARLDSEELSVPETVACLDALLALPEGSDEPRRLLGRLAPGLSTRAVAERPEALRRFRAEYRY
jgi:hypothetical protein